MKVELKVYFTVEHLFWDTSMDKIWSQKNVHVIFVSVTSPEGTALSKEKGHFLWVQKSSFNLHSGDTLVLKTWLTKKSVYFLCWLIIKKPHPQTPFRGHLYLGALNLGPEGVPWIEVLLYEFKIILSLKSCISAFFDCELQCVSDRCVENVLVYIFDLCSSSRRAFQETFCFPVSRKLAYHLLIRRQWYNPKVYLSFSPRGLWITMKVWSTTHLGLTRKTKKC